MDHIIEAQHVRQHETSGGARIFQIPLPVFPGMWGYAYLALVEDETTRWKVLIDVGSGFGESDQHLLNGFGEVSARLGYPFSFADLTHILISHGHIDHYGGLTHLRPLTPARLGVHELDLRNLTHYEERLTVVSHRLNEFLAEAGVEAGRRESLINLYKITKSLHRSVQVDFTYEAVGMRLGPFEMLHTPGHCAGHVIIRLHDVLFSGDHILEEISPHQSPEALTHSTGLGHYLDSLEKTRRWAGEVRLTLGGHKRPIENLVGRIDAIQAVHKERLAAVLELLRAPHTIQEVSLALFGETHGYNVLLALEETGAHVEYLYQRGLLEIENLKELENGLTPVPVRYRCLPCGVQSPPASLG